MEDGDEFTGRTVDDAIAQAETELGLAREALDIEVLAQGTRGVFGIGAEQARIRASSASTAGSSRDGGPARGATGSASSHGGGSLVADTAQSVESGVSSNGAQLADRASSVLRDLLQSMGFQAEVTVQNREDPLTLGVKGSNLGILIGRRGDNLSALQFMVNLILSKNRRHWPRVVLDIENYRARREDSLRALADRIAYRVERNGRAFTLEAMPASDRRIIHLALRDRDDVETYSIGEGPARRVVVAPKSPGRGDYS